MALHYADKGLKWPQLIAYCPSSSFKQYTKGFCPAKELAKAISSIFEVPFVHALTPPLFGDYQMRYKTDVLIEEKKVLLIGDFLNTSFFEAGIALAEGNPHSIYGLTFFSYE